tara:strand:- start:766 stop:915 length:150 start_codon:yes stop_codon:yes gene_type:complete
MDGQYGLRLCWLRRLKLDLGKLPAAASSIAFALAALAATGQGWNKLAVQ